MMILSLLHKKITKMRTNEIIGLFGAGKIPVSYSYVIKVDNYISLLYKIVGSNFTGVTSFITEAKLSTLRELMLLIDTLCLDMGIIVYYSYAQHNDAYYLLITCEKGQIS
jgi:hypothetical protein